MCAVSVSVNKKIIFNCEQKKVKSNKKEGMYCLMYTHTHTHSMKTLRGNLFNLNFHFV